MKSKRGINDQLDFDPSEDNHLYEVLFQQIEQEEDISINPKFSATILEQLKRKRKKEALRENIYFGLAIAGVFAFGFTVLQVISSFGGNSNTFLPKIILPATGLVSLIVIFQLVDHKLLKRKRFKRHLGI
ncbi:hypothetical protein [Roseivirga misakiensis]|uniref:Uncharacterized protein n=1 Tax=Roseivirga misakiensis TaxID=1563681 RepID=A0A1E5T073_9BACT|nr:hypothetical protein [Roseivirga misakiensis]OEK04782.1 hypothetical protein BFP71_15160 [Roseivirga misakiensis]